MTDHIEQTTEKTLASAEVTLTQAEQLLPGNIVAEKYQIISLLGRGGMGAVYRVKQIFLDQDLALKVLAHSSTTDDTHVRRFQIEGKAAFKLNHPNLVKVTDFGLLEDHAPYLVMEFIEGMTLAEFLKKEKQPAIDTVLKIVAQACLGLAYAHQNSVVHRDVKPSNIMLVNGKEIGEEGSVKIVDFGIAKVLNDQGEIQTLTQTGEVFGSPYYMSPEQCSGTAIDQRTDVYSLGCVLFEALTGTPPHVGQSPLRTMMLHQTEVTPSLQQASMGREFPPALEIIVKKMLEKEPSARYTDLGLVANDLANLVRGKASTFDQSLEENTAKSLQFKRVKMLIAASTLVLLAIAGWQFSLNSRLEEASKPEVPVEVISQVNQQSKNQGEGNTEITSWPPAFSDRENKQYEITADQLKEKSEQLRNAKPITPVATFNQGTTLYKIEFPKCGIGSISNALNNQLSHGAIKYEGRLAEGTIYFSTKGPYVFSVQKVRFPQTFASPSILEKFDKNMLNGLALEQGSNFADLSEPIQGEMVEMSVERMLRTAAMWKNLQVISLHDVNLSEQSIRQLNTMKGLKYASFSVAKNSKLLSQQPFIKQLSEVSLIRCDPSNFLAELSKSTQLKVLILKRVNLTVQSIRALRACPQLHSIGIEKFEALSDSQLEEILSLPHLTEIEFSKVDLSNSQVAKLVKSKTLKEIRLLGCITPEEEMAIQDKRFKFQESTNSGKSSLQRIDIQLN